MYKDMSLILKDGQVGDFKLQHYEISDNNFYAIVRCGIPSGIYVTSDNPLGVDRKTARSMIHPQYADRFIRQYILDEEIWRGK